ncbi:MAG: PAS domain-containing protein, partial [Candidatus Omnitrophica bacterium]|nr:PAS domain-containing protein [Candidatus Omnitrophota bacterium]
AAAAAAAAAAAEEDELKTLRKQMEFALGVTKTGLDIIDLDFNIVYVNPGWQKIYGDYKGRKCYEYFAGRKTMCPTCGIPKALETKEPVTVEEILPKEGDRPIQVTTIPFQNDKGEWLVAEVNVDITERKKAEEELQRKTHDLDERVKELGLLYAMSQQMAERDRSVDDVLHSVVHMIPSAWQYPDITCARIILEEKQFKTKNFNETKWVQSADIRISGETAGTVEVYYLQEKPAADEGPFLREERTLIDSVAEEIRKFIDRRKAGEELREKMESLEKFHKLAVGRELKMVEMKEEIKRVKAKLGKKNTD